MMTRQGRSANHVRHDKARGMIREKSREQFIKEHKTQEHELSQNREIITKLMNDGFVYHDTVRSDNRFDVSFIHSQSQQTKHCLFDFETNYTQLESTWRKRH